MKAYSFLGQTKPLSGPYIKESTSHMKNMINAIFFLRLIAEPEQVFSLIVILQIHIKNHESNTGDISVLVVVEI